MAFPHGLSLLQNTGTIILLALPAQNTATLSPRTAAPPGSFTAKHLGMIPEDVEEQQLQSRGWGLQVRGW